MAHSEHRIEDFNVDTLTFNEEVIEETPAPEAGRLKISGGVLYLGNGTAWSVV